jgi:hypothetical protein
MALRNRNRLRSSITGKFVLPSREKIGVRISKETGGAYADMEEVIESELAKIREKWAVKSDKAEPPRNNGSK